MSNNKKTLFIYPRKGLYLLTKCENCKHTYQCENCDANLVTYKIWENNMELICHQCQTHYSLPLECKSCGERALSNKIEGIDRLVEIIEENSSDKVIRLDNKKNLYTANSEGHFYVTTRIYDPSINYNDFGTIIFVSSENLLSSLDYLVSEDTTKQLTETILAASDNTKIIFDTNNPESDFFQGLSKLSGKNKKDLLNWFLTFHKSESKIRERFKFPPFYNLILITIQDKKKDRAWETINSARNYFVKQKSGKYDEISISTAYPARYLRRKGLFSYHFLIKYPKQYPQFFPLRKDIMMESKRLGLQVRLNPKHLF